MSGDSAASAPGRSGARPGRPVGRKKPGSRWGRFLESGLLLQGGVQGSPVIRLFMRWVRRPLLPVMRLWRRNIQLKVVATTLLMSLGVVLLLGFVVIGQVRNGLLDAKVKASQSQATGGFAVAKQRADEAASGTGDDVATADGRPAQNVIQWMSDLVSSLSSGGQGAFDVVTLPASDTNGAGGRGPRASGEVDWSTSVPAALRERVGSSTTAAQSYTRIIYNSDSKESQPGLVIGKQVNDPNGDPYQLYYLFPLTQEEKSLSLVKGTLATAGLFVVVLLGAIAWLVVRQVVTPVRMAAGIAERLSAGRLQERMKVTGEDDIARLGEAFNKMAQNLQLKISQLEDLSRMQRRFVSDVSHELRTPLTTVRMAADVIHEAREDFDPVTARSAELLTDQLDRFEPSRSRSARARRSASSATSNPLSPRPTPGGWSACCATSSSTPSSTVRAGTSSSSWPRPVARSRSRCGTTGSGSSRVRRRECSAASGGPTRRAHGPRVARAWGCPSPWRTRGCTAAGCRRGASRAAARSSG